MLTTIFILISLGAGYSLWHIIWYGDALNKINDDIEEVTELFAKLK